MNLLKDFQKFMKISVDSQNTSRFLLLHRYVIIQNYSLFFHFIFVRNTLRIYGSLEDYRLKGLE